MKRILLIILAFALMIASIASGEGVAATDTDMEAATSTDMPEDPEQLVVRSGFMDVAFTCLEKDNIFLRRYNEITDADVQPLFDLGVPYAWGGRSGRRLVSKLPYYSKFYCEDSSKFFKEGKIYLFGFDCAGFTKWVRFQLKMPPHDTIQNLIIKRLKYSEYRLFSHREEEKMPPFDELHNFLEPGDLLAAHHGSYYHIMMYIGTLRQYGFTADEVPELAEYLDYPLVIHCGTSPVAGERFQKLIDEEERYSNCLTTDGCVEISIIGIPPEKAPFHEHVQQSDFAYYKIDNGNYYLPIWDIAECISFVWIRLPDNVYFDFN